LNQSSATEAAALINWNDCMRRWLRKFFGTGVDAVPVGTRRAASAVPAAGHDLISNPVSDASASWTSAGSDPGPSEAPAPPVTATGPGISWLVLEDINAQFSAWLFARSDYADLQTSRAEQAVLETLDQILASPQAGTQLVRRMPGVIPQLLQSLRTTDFSGAELARKISHDVVLVAEVIRLANSSLYAKEDPITSIEHAVLVLGQNGLRHLITSVAFRPIIDLKSGRFNGLVAPRIGRHSEQCAIAARLLAQQAGVNGFDAFLAGLIQNVGLMVALRVMDQDAAANESIGSTAFCNALIPKARRLSASIGREWRFPEVVMTAIDEQAIVGQRQTRSAVGQMLSMADYLAKLNLLVSTGEQAPDPSFTRDLTAAQQDCYAELQALTAPVAPA
jgi:HD-like signal output (HDOD) protein